MANQKPGTSAVSAANQAAVARLQDRALTRLQLRNIKAVKRFRNIPFLALEVDETELHRLARFADIVSIEEDELYSPHLDSSIPAVGADFAWIDGFTGAGQAVAILDTGVDAGHQAFGGRVKEEACFSTTSFWNNSESLCPNGDNPNGKDKQIGADAAAPCMFSGCDHGTHVAGIAAGNDSEFSGVAKEADIIAIQVFSRFNDSDACNGASTCSMAFTSDIIRGLERVYELRNSYRIAAVNLSLGGRTFDIAIACDNANWSTKSQIDVLKAVGIATVISSGNNGRADAISAPGCISSAVTVGASDDGTRIQGFSNSASWLDFYAPGGSIRAPVPGGGFSTKSGTSMSAPHVTGAFALLRSKANNAGVDELVSASSLAGVPASDPDNGWDIPRIQLDAALAELDRGPQLPVNLIVDNDYDGAVTSGSFGTGTDSNYYGGRARVSNGTATDVYEFTPPIPRSGLYRIYAWWAADESNSNQAVFDVNHDSGQTRVFAGQRTDGSQWHALGEFDLSDDGSASVSVADANGGVAVADALRFELITREPDSDLDGVSDALDSCPLKPNPGQTNADADSHGDDCDNCMLVDNENQLDADGDGYGNICDPDLDNSGLVNLADLALFKFAFGTDDANADFDGSGVVNFADIAIFKSLFGSAPGPSGIAP